MANISPAFKNYDKRISLSKTEREYLQNARNAVTDKIKAYIENNSDVPKVEFIEQGSFTMGTIIKPLSGGYDIDVGVYLR